MTEFYHNLSMQALCKSNHELTPDFTRTSELEKSIEIAVFKKSFIIIKVSVKK